MNLLFLLIFFTFFATPSLAATSGPFRAVFLNATDCPTDTHPIMKNPPFIYVISYNETGKQDRLRANFTVLRETKNVKLKIKSFIWRRGKWEMNYFINNIECHGMLIHLIFLSAKIKYDRKNCLYLKGTYSTSLDFDELQHLMTNKFDYGRQMWTVEATISAGTIFCKEYYTLTEPIPNKKKNKKP